jgi:hypothetical protein
MIEKDAKMPELTGRRYRFHYLTAINLLQSMGIAPSDINIRAAGEYENYRGEVRSQDPAPGEPIHPGSRITLEVGCESAVDFMPYQFFYGLRGIRDTDGRWESDARSLMAPFDAATIRYEAATRMDALRYDFGVTDEGHLRRFMRLFEYGEAGGEGDAAELMFLAAVLPSLHMWGGNPAALTVILKKLFGYEVRLRENVRASTPIPEEIRYRLGSRAGRLGAETVLGRSFEECDSRYEVEFSGVPARDVPEMLPGGRTRRRVERILDYCAPGDLDYTISVKVERPAAGGGGEGHLGYSTWL